ncbi:hypothetical protein V6Z11_D05G376900 [Gossypium hirsutum]
MANTRHLHTSGSCKKMIRSAPDIAKIWLNSRIVTLFWPFKSRFYIWVNMEGYSSDGSTSFFGSNIPSEPQLPQQTDSLGVVDGWLELLGRDNGLVQDNIDFSAIDDGPTVRSLLDQHHQFNQGETSEASYQTVSEGGTRSKLTPAQRKENKRQSDYKYRQKRKVTADEQIGEIKRLKEEIQRFNVENGELKAQLGLLLLNAQFQAAAQQRQDGYITQSTGKQLHPQYVTVHGTNSEAVDKVWHINCSTCLKNLMHELEFMFGFRYLVLTPFF